MKWKGLSPYPQSVFAVDRVDQLGKKNLRLKFVEKVIFPSATLGKTSLQLKFMEY